MVTIKEMAQKIGVSPTTVSNVIKGNTKEVSQETIEKVERVLKESNYIPNMNAINLATKNSRIIGFVMDSEMIYAADGNLDAFVGSLVGGIEKQVNQSGMYLMLYISSKVDEIIQFVSSWNVDGLIAFGFNFEDAQVLQETYTKPLVFIDGYFCEDGRRYINVGLEDYQGAYKMTRYLTEQGHKRIACLSHNSEGVDHERYLGLKAAITDIALEGSYEKCFLIPTSRREVEAGLEKFVAEISDFTAVACCSDILAADLMKVLRRHGYHVPGDISLVGFDDIQLAEYLTPQLTTVHQDPQQKAIVAVEKVIQMLKGQVEAESVILPTRLVIRDSVRNIGPK